MECKVGENYKGWPLIKVRDDDLLRLILVEMDGAWSGSFISVANFEKCKGLPTPQAALDELASRLGYKQPIPTSVAMMVDKVRCEEEGW